VRCVVVVLLYVCVWPVSLLTALNYWVRVRVNPFERARLHNNVTAVKKKKNSPWLSG